MAKDSTFGLSPKQLARLLALAVGDSQSALAEMLTRELPVTSDATTIGEVLETANPRPGAIRTLKDHAKALLERRQDKAGRGAATAIYYAAIARALLAHGDKITRHSYETLEQGFRELEDKPWVQPRLKELFGEARHFCMRKMREHRQEPGHDA